MTAQPQLASKRKIYIVDDHAIVRLGMTQLINQQQDLEVCGEADNAQEALTHVSRLRPDLVIVDITLKGSDGIELIKNLAAQFEDILILVVSMHDESIYAELTLRAGAMGYIMKEEAFTNMLTAIRRVLTGTIYVSDRIAARMLKQQVRGRTETTPISPIERLSDRELQVFRLIGQWRGTRQIADELHLSIKTVEYYREKIKEKLGIKNATELIQYAVQWTQTAGTTPPSVPAVRGN
jgi:DNA-binding NarL/FixJ family response regulator